MKKAINDFQNLLEKKNINTTNQYLKEILYKFEFIFSPDILQAEKAIQYENNSKIIIVGECIQDNIKYYVLCFEYKLLILPNEGQEVSSILAAITNSDDCDIYFVPSDDMIFLYEIQHFSREFRIDNENIQHFWSNVVNCLCGFLIKKGYQNSRNKNCKYLKEKTMNKEFVEYKEENANYANKSYIELRNIGNGAGGTVYLIYLIHKEEVYALKIPNVESLHLIERERNNYLNLRYPFVVPYIGYIKFYNRPKYLLLEYVEGETLDKYKLNNLNDEEKYNIILELLLTIDYLHSQKYIYNDFLFGNIMINQNKGAILIDFDRVRKVNDKTEDEEHTQNLCCEASAPEKIKTYKSDVYSLSYVIHFILYGKSPKIYDKMVINKNYILKSCLEEDPAKRPDIKTMTNIFYYKLFHLTNKKFRGEKEQYLISLASKQNISEAQLFLGLIYIDGRYVTRDIDKAIHYLSLAANHNNPQAQFFLGLIYYKGRYATRDINKAIHYFSLAANQNDPKAQFGLGLIYNEGRYVTRDINKAIHYFSLAANHNIPKAQFKLGLIYYEGRYVTRDINKAIHYFSLAANQNDLEAQFELGLIYYKGRYVTRDINKAIHYFSLAANQNDRQAQFFLGFIYYEGRYVTRDINKAIHYFSLAANQNDPKAQFGLGLIYYEGRYVTRDINKAIHYLSLDANQNDRQALFFLGLIYYEGRYVTRDINKAIHYFSLAANQNDRQAQFFLGFIYYEGRYVTRDINKAIHYFSLAANQNDPKAQFGLGLIYYEGRYVTRDINKAIHYFSLAANQNDPKAQFGLGLIYYEGRYVTRDINKAIHYFSLAANQNHRQAQFGLGLIYYEGLYITRDINKAIHYFSLAANQNDPKALFFLGLIYYEGRYVTRDINKAIHYFSLDANPNIPQAQFKLGLIYYEGRYITRDINKAIHYFSLAANQNEPGAQFFLGLIYNEGRYVTRDINKAIHYLSLAANQNDPQAQFGLGLIYYAGKFGKQNIKKGKYFIMLASKNGLREANFAHGFLLHEGKYVKKDISEAISYYKEASSFNNQYSKNNLGIIYKHGYDKIEGNPCNAIVYFEEAIQQKKDYLSMYNLAHIYIYDLSSNQNINKSIDLLIKSMNEFEHSFFLLSLVLLKKFELNIDTIKHELTKRTDLTENSMNRIIKVIHLYKLSFYELYESYKHQDFLYNIELKPILSSELNHINEKVPPKYPNAKDLSPEFYKGFGEDL